MFAFVAILLPGRGVAAGTPEVVTASVALIVFLVGFQQEMVGVNAHIPVAIVADLNLGVVHQDVGLKEQEVCVLCPEAVLLSLLQKSELGLPTRLLQDDASLAWLVCIVRLGFRHAIASDHIAKLCDHGLRDEG